MSIHHKDHQPKDGRLRKSDKLRTRTARVGVGATTVVGGYFAYKYGVSDLLDTQFVPQPDTYPQVVEGMVAVNEGIRIAAPVVGMGMLSTALYFGAAGRLSKKEKTLNRLAKTEYSGVDDIASSDHSSSIIFERIKKFRTGIGVAALGAVLTMSVSGVENDITNGSLRPIDAVTSQFVPDGESYHMLLQSEGNTFMDTSSIPKTQLDAVVLNGQAMGIDVIPFKKELMNINDTSAIELSVPDTAFTSLTSVEIDESCDTIPAIVDDTLGAKVGSTIDINGQSAQVVRVTDDAAQMNRSIAIVSDSDMNCLKEDTDSSYYGAIIPGASAQDIEELLAFDYDNRDIAVVSEADFKENNRDFWRANGTPIILILMGSIAILGGVAAANERKNALQRNIREIGMLNAAGVSMEDIKKVETRRALSETIRATMVAGPVAPLVAAAFNAAEVGLKVGVGPREVFVGGALTLAAKTIGARRAVDVIEKKIDLSQAVKG